MTTTLEKRKDGFAVKGKPAEVRKVWAFLAEHFGSMPVSAVTDALNSRDHGLPCFYCGATLLSLEEFQAHVALEHHDADVRLDAYARQILAGEKV